MSRPLDGCTVVVTRPAAQARRFLVLATERGADCIALPTLVIEPVTVAPGVAAHVLGQAWDWALYTSTNAVESAHALLGRLPTARHTAAVGRATARALDEHGVTVDLRPDTANSEGLLSTPELNAVAGLSALLVKGAGGRDLLRKSLADRGAQVTPLEVYRRTPATPDPAALDRLRLALQSRATRVAILATSTEVLQGVLGMVPADLAGAVVAAPLVVPGARVATAALQLGWRGEIVTAATAEDEAMLAALRELAVRRTPPAAC